MDPFVAPLTQSGMHYMPIAQGWQHNRRMFSDGLPFMQTQVGQMAAMFGAQQFHQAMGSVGMVPMGLAHDQNVYDRMRNQQFTVMHMQAMQQAAAADRMNFSKTLPGVFQGLAAMTGTPFGAQQRLAANNLASYITPMMPMLAYSAPDLVDQLGGTRGSAVVLAQRLMDAGRYRLDPVTGRMGMSAATGGFTANAMFNNLYSPENMMGMRGISGGQLGSLFQELQMRGMVGAADPRMAMTQVLGDLRRNNSGDLIRAAASTGVDLGKAGGLTAADMDKLSLDPRIADKLRTIDTQKITQTLKSYTQVVSAMRDIFGDLGRPNAPMQELMAAVEAMTNGATSQLDPGRITSMVRQSYNLARQTGIRTDAMMAMQGHASARAMQLGMEPVFGVHALQGGMAFGGAYRALGQGAFTSWGAMNADQVQQLDMNLRLQAGSSNIANRMAVAARLADTVGFDPDSEAGRYAAAARMGLSDYVRPDGTTRSMMMGDREFSMLMRGARLRGGGGAGITESDVQTMLGQTATNREYVERYGLMHSVRRMQGRDELHPFIGTQMQNTITSRLQGIGLSRSSALGAASRISQQVTRRMFDMGEEQFFGGSRNSAIGGMIEEELAAAGLGGVLGNMTPEAKQSFLAMTAEQFVGDANRAIGTGQYSAFGNLSNVFKLTNSRTLAEHDRQQMQSRFTGQMQEALSPLGHGSLIRRTVDAFYNARSGDPKVMQRVLMSALGGVDVKDINNALLPQFDSLNRKREQVEQLQRTITQTTDPKQRATLMQQLDGARRELSAQAQIVADVGEQYGLFSTTGLSGNDISQALNATKSAYGVTNDLTGIRGGFGYDPNETPKQRAERMSTPWRASDEAISELHAANPHLSRDEVAELAHMRNRAKRLGLTEEIIAAHRAAYPKTEDHPHDWWSLDKSRSIATVGKYDGVSGELSAIGDLFAARAARQFDVSDAEIEAYRKSGVKAPTAGEIAKYREVNRITGDDAAVTTEMYRNAVFLQKRAASADNWSQFWSSVEGAAARQTYGNATDSITNTANQLLTGASVQRFGSRAITLSDTLRTDQQRLRELAMYHAGGDVNRLLAGDYSLMKGNVSDFAKRRDAVAAEVEAIKGRQQHALLELSSTEGQPGRQFQLGDEQASRKTVLKQEVAAGRMTQAEADAILAGMDSPQMQAEVERMQRVLGSESRARDILGIPQNKQVLSAEERDKINAIRNGTGSDETAKALLGPLGLQGPRESDEAYAKRKEEYDKRVRAVRMGLGSSALARERLGLKEDPLDAWDRVKGTSLRGAIMRDREHTGDIHEARRLMGKAPGENLTAEEQKQLETLTYGVGRFRSMNKDDINLMLTYEDKQKRLQMMADQRGIKLDDLESSPEKYLKGEDLALFKAMQDGRDHARFAVAEMAEPYGLTPEDLGGVTKVARRLNELQRAAYGRENIDPTTLSRDMMKAYGFDVGDSPDAVEQGLGTFLSSPSMRQMGMRALSSQQQLLSFAGRKGAGGVSGIDTMAESYFRALRSGSPEDMREFRKAYGMHELDSHGVVTGQSNADFAQLEQAMQFQQQTGLLGVGVGSAHRRGGREDFSKLFMAAMQSPAASAQSMAATRQELSGTVTIRGDQLDFEGSWLSGRAYSGVSQ